MAAGDREFLAERDARIAQMRAQGVSHTDIAKRFSLSVSAVARAIERHLDKLTRSTRLYHPQLVQQELERLDMLQQAQWPLTQHRTVTLPDGTKMVLEPDPKATQMVLAIMDRRMKLLGLDVANINITMDKEPVKSTLSGAETPMELSTHDPRAEVLKLLEIMVKSGVMSKEQGELILNSANPQLALPEGTPLDEPDEDRIKPLEEILEELGPEEDDETVH